MLLTIEKALALALFATVLERPATRVGRYLVRHAQRLRARSDIYQLGYERGYAEGYAGGRRIAKPVLLPPGLRIGP